MDQKNAVPKKPSMALLVVLSVIIVFGFLTGLAEMYRGHGGGSYRKQYHAGEKKDHVMTSVKADAFQSMEMRIASIMLTEGGKKKEIKGEGWTVNFGKDLKVAGKVCNRFSGSYSFERGTIIAKEVISTKMACMGDAMAAETAFFNGLNQGFIVKQKNAEEIELHDRKTSAVFVLRHL